MDKINKIGGFELNGEKYKINVIYYDHASKPEVERLPLIKKTLYSDKVLILFLGGSLITHLKILLLQRAKTYKEKYGYSPTDLTMLAWDSHDNSLSPIYFCNGK